MARIGIPRTLAYFIIFPFWKIFFNNLGHEVVTSDATTRVILDDGVKEAVSDACIPIKIFHGHVIDLVDKVDYIFIPRLVSMRKFGDFGTETFCPKFLGLPDMIKASLKRVPPILEARIDLKVGRRQSFQVYLDLGKKLGADPAAIKSAYRKATRIQKAYDRLLNRGMMPEEAMDHVFNGASPPESQPESYVLTLAVVGYPYTIYDSYINAGLLKIMRPYGVRVVTQDMLSNRQLVKQSRKLQKDLFWYFSNRAVQGALYYLDSGKVDGIIHVTAFACGPDSMVGKLIELEARKRQIPFLPIMIDEHTGEAGVKTRIEAFIDMLLYRRNKYED